MLEGFSFALAIGVLVGTYSSMFIASPVLHMFESRRLAKLAVIEAAAEAQAMGKSKKGKKKKSDGNKRDEPDKNSDTDKKEVGNKKG